MEVAGEGAEFGVVDRAREAVGAEQEDVARLDGQRPLDVDLDVELRAQAPGDHVLGDG